MITIHVARTGDTTVATADHGNEEITVTAPHEPSFRGVLRALVDDAGFEDTEFRIVGANGHTHRCGSSLFRAAGKNVAVRRFADRIAA